LQLALLGSLLASAAFCFPSQNARAECPAALPEPIFYMAMHTVIMQASSVIISEVLAESEDSTGIPHPRNRAIATDDVCNYNAWETSCGVVLHARSRSRWARRWHSRRPDNLAPIS